MVRLVALFLNWTPQEIVLLLLRYNASSSIINGTAQIPKDVTEDDEIITMLEGMKGLDFIPSLSLSPAALAVFPVLSECLLRTAAERRETRRLEEKLLGAAREGDLSALSNMVRKWSDLMCQLVLQLKNRHTSCLLLSLKLYEIHKFI